MTFKPVAAVAGVLLGIALGIGVYAGTQPDIVLPPNVEDALSNLQTQIVIATRPQPKRPWMFTNIPAANYWTYNVYARIDRQNSGFFPIGGSQFTVTPNGYPVGATIHARSQNYLFGVPASSACSVTWKGNATLQFAQYGGGSWQSTGANSGVLTTPAFVSGYDANGNPTAVLWVDVLSSDPANPLDDLEIWLPGYGPKSDKPGQLFRTEYLQSFAGFAGARFMGFLATATSTDAGIGDLLQTSNWDWTARGAPQGAAIELFREIHQINPAFRRAWTNVPIASTKEYQQAVVSMWHAAMPAGFELDVELGNENWNWNGGFLGWPFINKLANGADGKTPNPVYGTGDSLTLAVRAQADMVRTMSTNVRSVYVDRPNDLKIVFGCQAGNSYWASEGLRWEKATYGDSPYNLLADAPYFTWDSGNPSMPFIPAVGPWTLDQLHDGVKLDIDVYVRPQEQAITAIATLYALRHVNYEGGNAFWPMPFSVTSSSYLYCASPEIGKDCALYFFTLHDDCGVQEYFDFHHGPCDHWDQYGFWADIQNYDAGDPFGPGVKNYRWMELQRACARWN